MVIAIIERFLESVDPKILSKFVQGWNNTYICNVEGKEVGIQ